MNTKMQSTFAAALTVAAGGWILLIPAFTSVTGGALATVLGIGSVITLLGIAEMFWKDIQLSWLVGLAATWLLVASFAFRLSAVAAWNMALAALVTIALAVWDGIEVDELMSRSGAYHTHA